VDLARSLSQIPGEATQGFGSDTHVFNSVSGPLSVNRFTSKKKNQRPSDTALAVEAGVRPSWPRLKLNAGGKTRQLWALSLGAELARRSSPAERKVDIIRPAPRGSTSAGYSRLEIVTRPSPTHGLIAATPAGGRQRAAIGRQLTARESRAEGIGGSGGPRWTYFPPTLMRCQR
jgi:hypothetical protein